MLWKWSTGQSFIFPKWHSFKIGTLISCSSNFCSLSWTKTTFKQHLTCIFLPVGANLEYTLCHEGPSIHRACLVSFNHWPKCCIYPFLSNVCHTTCIISLNANAKYFFKPNRNLSRFLLHCTESQWDEIIYERLISITV